MKAAYYVTAGHVVQLGRPLVHSLRAFETRGEAIVAQVPVGGSGSAAVRTVKEEPRGERRLVEKRAATAQDPETLLH